MKGPRCERCGTRIYQYRKPFAINVMGISHFNWKTPLHCQNCGAALSSEKISQVYGYSDSIFLGVCFGSVILIIIILAISFSLR
ncbi:MAG: hypothetical protein ACTSQL_04010 [Promethearchaeota archaeon]